MYFLTERKQAVNQAAFQEAEELKDLIREADAERDTLHDQLKQMRHECLGRKESVTVWWAMHAGCLVLRACTLPSARSCSFRVPEGVDEMIGTVTELTQKLDAALDLAQSPIGATRTKDPEFYRCFRPAWTYSQPATTTTM